MHKVILWLLSFVAKRFSDACNKLGYYIAALFMRFSGLHRQPPSAALWTSIERSVDRKRAITSLPHINLDLCCICVFIHKVFLAEIARLQE